MLPVCRMQRGLRRAAPADGCRFTPVRVDGEREFAAPRGAVFAALVDPQLVAGSLPGVSNLRVEGPDRWKADVAMPFVPHAPRLTLTFDVVERREPEHARLHAAGKRLGASFRLESGFALEEAGGGTRMRYEVDVRLGGILGRVGGAAAEPVARQMIRGLLDAVDRGARAR
jgi:carbon monoxide dehydrogenase subunit G